MGRDQAQRLLGIEFHHPGDAPAREQSGVRQDERRVVIERAGIEQRHAVRDSEQRFRGRVDDRGLVIEDYLGPSGRAATGHRLPVARHRAVDRLVRHAFRRKISRHRIGRIPVGFATDHQSGFENLEHRGGFAARQPPGQRGRRRAALPHRKAGLEEGIAVGQADGDEITRLHALGGKGAGAAVGAALELLPGQRVGAMADRNRVLRLAFGIPARHVGYGDQHAGLPSPGFCCERRAKSRPPRLIHQRGGVVTQCGHANRRHRTAVTRHNLAQVCRECRGPAIRPRWVAMAISKLSAIRRAFPMNNAAAAGGQTSEVVCSNSASQRSKCFGSMESGRWACMGWP